MTEYKKNQSLPKINLYRNISLTFVLLTIVLLAVVLIFFYNQATITITPEVQKIDLSFNVEIKSDPNFEELAEKDVVAGYLISREKEATEEFEVLSTKTVSSELVGKVKIINNSSRSQPLLRTTQLQAPNGVVVRTNEAVTAPAGGEVTVVVYPRDPEEFKNIDFNSRLVIIRLAPSLQNSIYGVAMEELTTSPREVKALAAGDVNRAKNELGEKLINELKSEMNLAPGVRFSSEIISAVPDQPLDAEVDDFNLKLKARVTTLEIDQNQLTALIIRKINNLNLTGLQVEPIDLNNLEYMILERDLAGSVLIKVNYSAFATIDETHSLLAKNKLAGQTLDEARFSLENDDLIKEVEIKLTPGWRQRLPKQENKIKIIIK